MKNERTWISHFKNIYSSNIFYWTISFGLGLLVFEWLCLPTSRNSLFILKRHLESGGYLRLFFVIFLTITAFALFLSFIYAALASSRLYRLFYFLIFSILISIEYGYYKAFESFQKVQEAEVALFATNSEIITTAIALYFNYLAIIPIVAFGILLIFIQTHFKRGFIPLIVVIFSLTGFFFATTYFTQNTYYVHSFNYGVRTFIALPVIWYVGTLNDTPKSRYIYTPREKVDYQSPINPTNNVVLIIDESVRSDHLSLNGYEHLTTPTLERLNKQGFIKNWGTAVSGGTCSMNSNNLILTGLRDLPDTKYKIYVMPTIFQYAKAMNYKNYYFDGQVSTLWNGKNSDIAYFGNWVSALELEKNVKHKYDIDIEIARRIGKIVNNSTGNFIWVNKFGVHKPYSNSYPKSRNQYTKDTIGIKYTPEIDGNELKRQYDEAIKYNSESFFTELIKNIDFSQNTIFIYTSDHGQTLREAGATASHCSHTKPEAGVPLFLLSSPENLPEVDTNYKASHANILATLLDLMKFPDDKRKYNYAISLLKAKPIDSRPRFYYVGDLHNTVEGRKYAFDD